MEEKETKVEKLRAEVENLYLDFSFQISTESKGILLKPNGDEISVTLETLKEYVELVVKYYLSDGVADRLKAFRRGFNQVFPMQNVAIFSEDELLHLIGGSPETPWDLPSNQSINFFFYLYYF